MSTTERITLEEEIDYLDSYLGLQKMRLDSKMEYKIELDLKQNIKEYSLPPMLIQPLVENSILHGISSLKDRIGWVIVRFEEDEEYIKVTVKDNGIGIKASQKIKGKSKQLHKSFATQILRERINIINYLKNKNQKGDPDPESSSG